MKTRDRNDAMNRFTRLCRERGLPLTWQRRTVFETLAGREDHPTADALYTSVAERFPGISRTTVYRVLDTLVELGVANRASHPGAAVRYDALTHPHHHVVCTRCGRMEDVVDPALDALTATRSRPHGFRILEVTAFFRGLCPDCRRNEPGRTPGAKRRPKKETSR